MAGTHDEGVPSLAVDSRSSPIRPNDERKAADIAGLCDALLQESGFSLIEVGADYAVRAGEKAHQLCRFD